MQKCLKTCNPEAVYCNDTVTVRSKTHTDLAEWFKVLFAMLRTSEHKSLRRELGFKVVVVIADRSLPRIDIHRLECGVVADAGAPEELTSPL